MTDDNERRFEELFGYYRRVVGFFRHHGHSDEDARDLAQEVYVRVFEHMDTYRGEAKWNYLEQVARRIALNAFRDRNAAKRKADLVSDEKLANVEDASVVPADVALERQALSHRLGTAIEQLDLNLRICVLYYLQGFSYHEIEQTLGLSESTLKSRLHDARKRLKQLLGDDLAEFGGDS
jgi:RNA polymerase sigma-70 factor (ECF subfamily)